MLRESAHFQESEPFLEKFLSRLRFRKILPLIPPNAKVLDLGCGYNADLLRAIEDRIFFAVGIDLKVNKNFRSNKIKLLEHDLNRPLPFQENTFDVVTSLANLEHLERPERVLREIKRVLRPGGRLFLTTPSIYAKPVLEFLSFDLGWLSEQEILDHKHYFNRKRLERHCQSVGFQNWHHRYFQLGMNNFLMAVK
jgi:SAM-dependent methyltransferase